MTSNCKLSLQNDIMGQLSIDLWPLNLLLIFISPKIQIDVTIFSRVIPIIIEVGISDDTKTEKLNGVDPDKLRKNELSDGSRSSSVIFINELKVKMLIYNFQMGGKSEGNKKMINVPIRMEIKDNDLISETSNNKQYSSQNKKVKIKK